MRQENRSLQHHSSIPEAVAKICNESDVKKFIHVSASNMSENLSQFIKIKISRRDKST